MRTRKNRDRGQTRAGLEPSSTQDAPDKTTSSSTASRRGSRWTLRKYLVVTITSIVCAVVIAVSALACYSIYTSLLTSLDAEIASLVDNPNATNIGKKFGDEQSSRTAQLTGPAQRVGNLRILIDTTRDFALAEVVDDDGDVVTLSDELVTQLLDESGQDGTYSTLDLGDDLGTYRILRKEYLNGTTVILGQSMNTLTTTLGLFIWIMVAIDGTVTVLAALLTAVVVRHGLKPLDRITAVAHDVTTHNLAEAQFTLPQRLSPADTDPDTETGQVGLALNRLLDHVESALEQRQHSEEKLRQFVADASHELRTPLAAIRGYAELAGRTADELPPTVASSIDRIESESVRMSSLVNDLLLLARIDAGQRPELVHTDILEVVTLAMSDCHVTYPDHPLGLDFPDDLGDQLIVWGDHARLHQIVLNLISNACTHTEVGTPVTVRLGRHDGMIRLSVIDQGPGIDESVSERIFERFARGDASRSGNSNGLGLAITKALVEIHHGTITVHSQPGRTEFCVDLPSAKHR